ncbi:aldose 1-epimerase [Flavihumibacter petaseus]|uniref:Aldose 1-epimerase n=1 Tax=Flavihumibacter petaseus NBRC 106054 TaxID=1220578 RepID=A0A0E9N6D1_9BACT|nr:aldose 1-epimerase [Flavihumibacter petaseus]GAO45281.1 hypothetical protein FPE01S_04_05250 [Flavihumibacter petaseus NBRC 106054]
MSFRISHSTAAGIPLVQLHDDSLSTTVSIIPHAGAMLHGFSTVMDGQVVNVIDHYPDATNLDRELSLSYKSSKLSPFPCRIEKGRYSFEGKAYQFDRLFPDGSAIHGLLFDRPFEVTRQDVTSFMATAVFQYDYPADDAGYPFPYRCVISYALFPGNKLQLQTTISNTGSQKIPIGDGWHPYFQLGGQVDQWTLKFPADGMLEFNDQLLPTGRMLEADDFRSGIVIGDRQLDNCFLLDANSPGPVCTLGRPETGWSIDFFTDGQYPFLQLYIPPHRQSIAIENLSMAPNGFHNQMGVTILDPGESKTLTVFYQLNTGETA